MASKDTLQKTRPTISSEQKPGVTKAASSGNSVPRHFPVVGFGASAGGIEAISTLLKNLDPNLGMAYVLVMHLSPNHKSSLAEIMQTKTKMPVHTVKDGMEVKPDHVYVIPPNAFMSLVDGHLKLAPRNISTIGNFAVDYFLTTLASTYKNNSIGIILSGTATDGTLGLKAIKAEGGITFAQDDSAKFSGMPRSAYDSGYADFILSPQKIARELAQLAKVPYTVEPSHKIERKQEKGLKKDTEALKKILSVVKAKTGIDFFLNYKQASVYRRVLRRVVLNKCRNLDGYFSMLLENEKEVHDLYNDFLINVTAFFRDEEFYRALQYDILPSIIKNKNPNDPIRVWVAGCATGEEAYSIAITLKEFLQKKDLDIIFQIFASDLDKGAIEKARLGIYPVSALQNVPQQYLKRYFKKLDSYYFQIEKTVREVCIFSPQNLLKDPPFSRMDLISCQNVLIYLETEPQQRILHTFHYALKPSGFLFLGKSESIGAAGEVFNPLDKKIKIYSPKASVSVPLKFTGTRAITILPREIPRNLQGGGADLEKELGKVLLTRFVPPSVVLNQNLNIVQFFGITAPFLHPVVGKASLNVLKMIRDDLLIDLRALLQHARKTGKITLKEGIKILIQKIPHDVTIEVVPKKVENELYYLVVFLDRQIIRIRESKNGKASGKTKDQKEKIIVKLEEELLQSREVIRTTNEEYETTYEELQAYNEEILSSNEELQSLNEELETSKEELQSANEELSIINEELEKRNRDLRDTQDYAKAIVNTVSSPFLVLTPNLQIRSANRSFYKTFKLEAEQSEGHFIYELGDHSWDIPAFRENLNELLGKKSNYLEFELRHTFPDVGELWFIINAYRLLKVDSARETLILLAFMNISDLMKANLELKKVNEHLEQFAFVASHDLQEPLRKIQTFSSLLSEHDKFDAFTRNNVDKINSTASKMTTLLKDLVNYSGMLKSHERNFVRIDLNVTVKNACKDLQYIIEERKAVMNIDVLPEIEGDPGQIEQLFFNLILNALKFNNSKPVITITSEKNPSPEDFPEHHMNMERQYYCISVKDNGIGFDQKYAEKIFIILQKLNDKKDVQGSGMGLAFCKKIAEHHGGSISATGKVNEGAIFRVLLPAPIQVR